MADATDIIREFVVALGYKVDEEGLKKFVKGVTDATKAALELGSTMTATAVAIEKGVEKVAKQMEDLYYAAQRSGAAEKTLAAMEYAFTQIGLGATDAQAAVHGLYMSLLESPGKETILQNLGIQTRAIGGGLRDTTQILHDFVRRVSTMAPAMAFQYAQMFGIPADLLVALIKNLKDADKAQADYLERMNKAGLSTEELDKQSKSFMESVRRLNSELGIILGLIEKRLIPIVQPVIDFLEQCAEWVAELDKRTDGWSSRIIGLLMAFGTFSLALLALKGILGLLGIGFTSLTWLVGIFWAVLTSPVTLAVAALLIVAGVAYIIWKHWEDLRVGLGVIWGWIMENVIQPWVDAMKLLGNITGTLFHMAGQKIEEFVANAFSWGVNLVQNFKNGIARMWDDFRAWLNEKLKALTDSLPDWAKSMLGITSAEAAPATGEGTGAGGDAGAGSGAGRGPGIAGMGGPPSRVDAATVQKAMAFFTKAGWTTAQAAGIVSNLLAESALNPRAIGDKGTAYGIAQWHPDRWQRLLAWARTHGNLDPRLLDTQMAFVNYEMREGTEQFAGAMLAATNDAVEAGRRVSRYYERPRDVFGQMGQRGLTAGSLANQVTINQNTDVHVTGGADPEATGRAVARQQDSVNDRLLRNMQGVVR